jgi:GNAT superfamily N-acetyltransferase
MSDLSSPEPSLLAADTLSLDDLTAAFNRAFEGYFVPMVHTAESLAAMIAGNDIRLDLSLVAWTPAIGYAGVALLARRGTRSWIGGMGVVPERRGQGIGRMLLGALIGRAHADVARSMQLEVLDQNVAAQRLYASLGFRVVRPLYVFTGTLAPSDAPPAASECAVVPVSPDEALAAFDALHWVAPPWQRERASLEHTASRLSGLGLRDADGLRTALLYVASDSGFAIMDVGSSAPSPAEREADAAALLRVLTRDVSGLPVRAINVPPADALGDALTRLECPVVASQREMDLDLT